jgi:hypothetical protein
VGTVAVIAVGRRLCSLHDGLCMKALLIFFLNAPVAPPAGHPLVRSFLSPFGVGVVFDAGVATGTGEFAVNRILEFSLGNKKRNFFAPGILL